MNIPTVIISCQNITY